MTKKNFIALADRLAEWQDNESIETFSERQIQMLADFCKSQNPRFDRSRWLAYIAGECGPNGGKIK